MDLDGTISYCEPRRRAALWLSGSRDRRPVGEAAPPTRAQGGARADPLIPSRGGERIEHFETTRLTKDGRTDRRIADRRRRCWTRAGAIVGASSIARDLDRSLAVRGREPALRSVSRSPVGWPAGIARELVDLVTAIQGHASLVLEDLAEDPRTSRSAGCRPPRDRNAPPRSLTSSWRSAANRCCRRAPSTSTRPIAASIQLLGEVAGRSTTIDLELDPLIADVEVDPDQLDHVLGGPRRRFEGPAALRWPDHDRHATRQGRLRCHRRGAHRARRRHPDPGRGARVDLRAVPSQHARRRWQPVAGHRPRDPCPVGRLRARHQRAGRNDVHGPPAGGRPGRCRRGTADRSSPCRAARSRCWSSRTRTTSASFLARALSRLGYAVTAVASGEEALAAVGRVLRPARGAPRRRCRPARDRPGPSWRAALAARRGPELPVLYISGHASDLTAFHGLPGLADQVLAKPFGTASAGPTGAGHP